MRVQRGAGEQRRRQDEQLEPNKGPNSKHGAMYDGESEGELELVNLSREEQARKGSGRRGSEV